MSGSVSVGETWGWVFGELVQIEFGVIGIYCFDGLGFGNVSHAVVWEDVSVYVLKYVECFGGGNL